jgi:hypothetical protein
MPFAPFPFVGLLPFALWFSADGLRQALRRREARQWLRGLFSPYTAVAAAVAVPFALYFYSNAAVQSDRSLWFWAEAEPRWAAVVLYFFFLLLDVGILAAVLYPRFRRDPLYWLVCGLLAVFPLFAVGNGSDFCMRASIPALLLLTLFSARTLLETLRQRRWNKTAAMLAVCLLLGAATPTVEVGRGIAAVVSERRLGLVADNIGTLADKGSEYSNFLTFNAQEKPFFRYLARIQPPDNR